MKAPQDGFSSFRAAPRAALTHEYPRPLHVQAANQAGFNHVQFISPIRVRHFGDNLHNHIVDAKNAEHQHEVAAANPVAKVHQDALQLVDMHENNEHNVAIRELRLLFGALHDNILQLINELCIFAAMQYDPFKAAPQSDRLHKKLLRKKIRSVNYILSDQEVAIASMLAGATLGLAAIAIAHGASIDAARAYAASATDAAYNVTYNYVIPGATSTCSCVAAYIIYVAAQVFRLGSSAVVYLCALLSTPEAHSVIIPTYESVTMAARTLANNFSICVLILPTLGVWALSQRVWWHARRRLHILFVRDMQIAIAWRYVAIIACILVHAPTASAVDDDMPSSSRPPMFAGERAAWTAWLIALGGYCAWKLTDSADLLTEPPPPRPTIPPAQPGADANAPPLNAADIEAATTARDEYDRNNRRLYGLLISALPPWLATTLHLNTCNDGVASMARLRSQFGAVNTNDLASAITRVNSSYVDSRADLSENDLRHQFDAMQVANADIVRANGTAIVDDVLKVMFDNSLPNAYTQIRQLVRRANHTTFIDHFNDYISLVKAEMDARASHSPANAFSAGFIPAPPDGGGRGRGGGGGGGGGRGRGRGKGKGKGSGRGGGSGAGRGSGSGSGNVLCFRCLSTDHTRDECTQPVVHCDNCSNHADHDHTICPFGSGGTTRDNLSGNQLRRLTVEAGGSANSAQPRAHTAQSQTQGQPPPPPVAPPQPPQQPTQQAAPAQQPTAMPATSALNDEQQEWLRAIRGYCCRVVSTNTQQGWCRTVRGYCSRVMRTIANVSGVTVSPGNPHAFPVVAIQTPAALRMASPSATMYRMFVDSMASVFILRKAPPGSVVTNAAPTEAVQQLSGTACVQSIVKATLWLPLEMDDGTVEWTNFIVPDIHIIPDASADLWSTRVLRDLYGAQHTFEDDLHVYFNGRYGRKGRVPFRDTGDAFVIEAGFGSPRAPTKSTAMPASALAEPVATEGTSSPPLPMVPTTSPSPPPPLTQEQLWRRLGYPHEAAWRYVTSVLIGHGQPPNATLSTNLVAPDAVMRGRMRALQFVTRNITDRTLPAPGSVFYMDFLGPVITSVVHRFKVLSGIVDAGSGFGRAFPHHLMTKEVARATYESFVAQLSSLLGLTHTIKPQLVVSDQGSGYVAHHFREFLSSIQVLHRPSAVYTPQQNPFIERMWGSTFSATRIMLAGSNLPPTFWPFAVQTARWVLNRLPQPSRGNLSPYTILTRRPADVRYLYAFGCQCDVYLAPPQRDGDKHLADRGVPGIYLGPSEESPASVVYDLSTRTIRVSRHVVPYDDRFPGLKGLTFDWRAVLGEEGVPAVSSSPVAQIPQAPSAPAPLSNEPAASPADTPPSSSGAPPSPAYTAPSPPVAPTPRHSATPHSRQEGAPPRFNLPSVETHTTVHPQASDPRSNNYDRHAAQPQLTRQRKPATRFDPNPRDPNSYRDPLVANMATARANFAMSAMAAGTGYDPAITYALEAVVDLTAYCLNGTTAMVAAVKSTVEMGDVIVPKSYTVRPSRALTHPTGRRLSLPSSKASSGRRRGT